ncbi:hypothetical protein BH23GEM1_BH23GEM1_00770 [soil metagenome]
MRNPATTFALTFAGTARPTWWSALVLLVVATFGVAGCADQEPITPLSSQKALAPSGPDALGHKRVEQSERRVTELPDGRVLEELHGEPAYRHLQQLMSRRPEAFANLSLPAKGYRPSGEVLIQRVTRPQHAALRGDGFFMLAQSYQESNSEGEIIFWSWDDGAPDTWEGVIWFEDYTRGIAGTNEAQVDISSTESHELVFLENRWESGGGGGGPGVIEPMWNPAPCATIAPGVRFASLDVGSMWVAGGYTLASSGGWSWRRWGGCTVAGGVGGCAGAAVGCALAGPGWAKCTGAFCAGAFVGAAIGCGLSELM